MLKTLRLQSTLQFRLVAGVVLAFLITLMVSTTVLITSVNRLGKSSISEQVEDEQLIIAQRFVEAEQEILNDASFIASQVELINAVTDQDIAYIQSAVEDSSKRFIHDAIIVSDRESMTIINQSNDALLLEQQDFKTLQEQALRGDAIHTILVSSAGAYIIAIVPIVGVVDDKTRLGTITVADQLDSQRLGELNFGRSNMALVFFTYSQDQGISANEANGLPHLSDSQIEMLRPDETTLEQIMHGETVHYSNVHVNNTPHAVVYQPLQTVSSQVGYYVLAFDEGNLQKVQNNIILTAIISVVIMSIAIAILLMLNIHTMIIRPVMRLCTAAYKIASGELDTRVPLEKDNEIGMLINAFNDMATKIETRSQQLDELNQTLEARITTRTAEVEQQSAWLETILRGTQEAILVTDQTRNIRLINAAALEIIQLNENQALGEPIIDLLNRVSADTIHWPDHADDGLQGEVTLKDDQHFRCSISPLNVMQPEHQGYVCVLTDISALRKLDTLKTRVIQMAAHDLRSPLMSLRLQNHLIKREHETLTPIQAKTVKRMEATITDMQNMVTDLLDIERIERQAHGFQESVDIGSLIEAAVSLVSNDIENKGHVIDTRIPNDLPYVCGDPVPLLEVLRNLLTNAIKYTPPGGHIWICVSVKSSNILIEVKDSGIGINEEDIPNLFTPHFRAKTALRTSEDGKGIGLGLVKDVIEQQGGHIWVESTVGVGSIFSFSLPHSQQCKSK